MKNALVVVVDNVEKFVVELVYKLWCSSGEALGMGMLQNRPNATKEEVYVNAVNEGDYVGGRNAKPNAIHMDYVFGRMVKTDISWNIETNTVSIYPYTPRTDYQGWGNQYANAGEIATACAEIAGVTIIKQEVK